MEFITVGRDIYPGLEVLLHYDPNESNIQQIHTPERFRLVLVTKGTGIMNLGGARVLFQAPAVFCINETEIPFLEQQSGIEARSLYFHPNAVQEIFNFENIRKREEGFSYTEIEDAVCLLPFFERTGSYCGHIPLGLQSAKRMQYLFNQIHQVLTQQKDVFWPCRSRSFFLELLFCIERLYSQPEDGRGMRLDHDSGEMDQILLYLHTYYNKKVTMEDLTKHFNIDRTTLNKQFNRLAGMPVMTYLIKHRVHLASMILRDTKLPVAEIADQVGFGEVAHFNRIFRKYTQHSPTEYRQQYSWME